MAGSTLSSRTDWSETSHAHDDGGTSSHEPSGAYLLVRGDGLPITVRCAAGGTVRKAWTAGSRARA